MTIEKIIRISNIGRLRALKSVGDMSLRKYNLLLAENGRGKSTLCAILRSLQTGDVSHIRARRSLGATEAAGVELRLTGGNVNFDGNAWSRTIPELLIFDATFVSDNVYVGDSVGTDNKRNLLQVMLGSRGRELAERVSTLVEEVTQASTAVAAAKSQIAGQLERGANFDAFLALRDVADIRAVITRTEAALNAIRQSAALQARPSVQAIFVPAIPKDFSDILALGIEGISEQAEEEIKKQIAHHKMGAPGEAWLAAGVPFVVDEQCPFCGEATAGNALVQHFKDYFSQGYKEHKARLDASKKALDASLGEGAREKFANDILRNDAAVNFWREYVADLPYGTLPDQEATLGVFRNLHNEAARLLNQKLAAPLEVVKPDAAYLEALAAYSALGPALDSYMAAIAPTDAFINDARRAAGTGDPKAVEAELVALRRVQLRFSDGVRADVTSYTEAVAQKAAIEERREAAKKELDEYADGELAEYQGEINKILRKFGVSFSVDGTARSYVGRTPSSSYRFLIDTTPVELGDENTRDRPCFKTSMSAGDKSALALAFFLAHLERDPEKANRVVVFDDPFTSFDASRREETAQMIRRVGELCAQVIVLSHDSSFLSLVLSRITQAGDVRTLRLSRVGRDSTLTEWNAAETALPPYVQDVRDIRAFVDGAANDASSLDVIRKMRPVLEGFLRRHFRGMFADGIWLGTMLEQIRDGGAGHPLAPQYEEITAINDYTKRYFHEGDANPTEAPISEEELDGFCRRTMTVVGGW